MIDILYSFNQRKIPSQFHVVIFTEVCQEGGIWNMLRIPDWECGGQGYPLCHGSWMMLFYPKEVTL